MPVSLAPRNVALKIVRVAADEKVRRHLMEMGVAEGGAITLISSSANGVIVVVKEGRLCLDGSLACNIFVA